MEFQESVLGRMNGFLYRCRADADYTMLAMTDGVERVFGYPAEDIVGNRVHSFSSLISEQDLSAMDAAVGAALEAKANWSMEYRMRHKDGRLIWVAETGGGIWDANGELLYLEGSIISIDSLYQRLEEQNAEMRVTASKTGEILHSLRYLKLLAVNAGIEAARAGNSGAGFAFLAAEMRQLANASEETARQITQAQKRHA